jgi:hypothetical protein
MKNKVYPTLLVIAALFVCTTARATLIGDTITISLQSPLGSSYFSTNTVVQAGTGDQVALNGLSYFVANPEASSITLSNTSTISSVSFPNVGGFNGLVVTGINDTMTSFTITTNLVGWDNSRLTFDAHGFSADFRGLIFTPRVTDGLVDLEICVWTYEYLHPGEGIPDSGSSAVLLAIGVLGLAAVSRRFGSKN